MNLEYLQKVSKDPRLQDAEYFMCQNDPYYFLTNWAFTIDVHDQETNIKPFPKKEYIKIVTKYWLKHPLLLVPKSRQMMMSWLFTALYLWDAQFHSGRLIFFQSKREDDADDLVKRAKTIWDNEPRFLKRYREKGRFTELLCNPQSAGRHIFCKMSFPAINSEIRGIPQGGDIIRMHTVSGILSDEMGYQPEAEDAYEAAKPTLSSKGRFTGVSTAEDYSFFESMVFDKIVMN